MIVINLSCPLCKNNYIYENPISVIYLPKPKSFHIIILLSKPLQNSVEIPMKQYLRACEQQYDE